MCYSIGILVGETVSKAESRIFIRLWNIRGYQDIWLMCNVFDLSKSAVLKKVSNHKHRGVVLKSRVSKTIV